jgi:predicted membrane protein
MVDDPKLHDTMQRIATGVRNAAEQAAMAGHDAAQRAARHGQHSARRFHRIVQLVIGLLIVTAGVLFTLDNLRILHARDYLQYWPVGLIVIGVAQIVEWRSRSRFLAGGLWILIGVAMLARRLGFTDVNIWAYWPMALVFIGGRLIWQAHLKSVESGVGAAERESTAVTGEGTTVSSDAVVSALVVMGGFGRKVTSQAFQRAELTAFLGGGKIDLREAKLAGGEAVIDVFTIMGGFEILVPDTWDVIVEATPLMGGIDDKTRQRAGESAPRLIIRGLVMMGGVEIKN